MASKHSESIPQISQTEIYFNAVLDSSDNSYFVAEYFWDKLVINEKKLNNLTLDIFKKYLDEISADYKESELEELCIDFIVFVLKKWFSVQKIYHFKTPWIINTKNRMMTTEEKIAFIDDDVDWKRSELFQKSLNKLWIGKILFNKEKFFKIIDPDLQLWDDPIYKSANNLPAYLNM